jgi:type III secretion protein C
MKGEGHAGFAHASSASHRGRFAASGPPTLRSRSKPEPERPVKPTLLPPPPRCQAFPAAGLPLGRLAWALALAGLAGPSAAAPAQPQPMRLSLDTSTSSGPAPSAAAAPRAPRANGHIVATPERNWGRGRFVYRAEGKRLLDVLQDFAASQGVPAVVGDGVEGVVNANFDARPHEFLDGIARAYNLMWYHDGTALYFYPGRAVQSRLFRLRGFRKSQVTGLLRSLEVGDKRYPIRFDDASSTLYVSGPPRHVELVTAALDALDAGVTENANRTVRVFNLHFASAADRQMGDVVVPGVANTLRKLYGGESDNPISATGGAAEKIHEMTRRKASPVVPMPTPSQFLPPLPRANAKDGSSRSEPVATKGSAESDEAPPRFEADEGSNSVVVHGRADRMAEYESLIRRLDKKPRLIELEATIIEVNSDSVEALGVNWSMRGPHGSLSVSGPDTPIVAAGNAFALGTVISDAGRELLARVNALQGEGKARVLSKPSVLGVANRTAVMREKRVATVRVAGNLEANLFQIEAGTLLEMTPQVTDNDGSDIKLSLYIEDGSFETRVVDQVPIVKKTEIRTEAYVREGESLLIGGITVESDQALDNGVPGLSRLPLLGGLFRSSERQKHRIERLFLITPRLLGSGVRPVAAAPAPAPASSAVSSAASQAGSSAASSAVSDVSPATNYQEVRNP